MNNIQMALITAGCTPMPQMPTGNRCETENCHNHLLYGATEKLRFCGSCLHERRKAQARSCMNDLRKRQRQERVEARIFKQREATRNRRTLEVLLTKS